MKHRAFLSRFLVRLHVPFACYDGCSCEAVCFITVGVYAYERCDTLRGNSYRFLARTTMYKLTFLNARGFTPISLWQNTIS